MNGVDEAYKMANLALRAGIPQKDILIESKSTNTYENALFSKNLLIKKGFYNDNLTLTVIVKHYHSRRALMSLRKHFPEPIKLKACSYDVFDFNKEDWHEKEFGRKKVFEELKKIRNYQAFGHLAEI